MRWQGADIPQAIGQQAQHPGNGHPQRGGDAAFQQQLQAAYRAEGGAGGKNENYRPRHPGLQAVRQGGDDPRNGSQRQQQGQGGQALPG